MLLRIADFELRQQVRSHAFRVVFAISLAMVLGAFSVEALRVGWIDGSPTGAAAVLQTHLLWSLFYLFTAAAFVGDAVLRDDLTGFAPMVRASPVRTLDYLLGRFLGGFAAVLLCFLSVPLALVAAGASAPGPLLFAFLALALPNLFLASALFFGLATATRSMMGTYLGAVALLAAYGVGIGGGNPLLEPFGFTAVEQATAHWPAALRDAEAPALTGTLLLNRLIWLAAGLLAVALACAYYRREPRPVAARAPASGETEAAPAQAPLPQPVFGNATVAAQLAARTALELRQLVLTPAFAILLLLGVAHVAATLWQSPVRTTGETIRALIIAFQLVPVVVALFFAGELMWNERDRRIHELIAATPMPSSAFVLPKLLALALIFLGLVFATAAAAMLVELLRGTVPEAGAYLTLYILPKTLDWLLVGVLALFLQALSPSKLAGWGWMVLYLIASLGLEQAGFTNPVYRYGSYPGAPLPEGLSGASGTWPYRLQWIAIAALMAGLAVALTGRGLERPLGDRLRQRRSTGT